VEVALCLPWAARPKRHSGFLGGSGHWNRLKSMDFTVLVRLREGLGTQGLGRTGSNMNIEQDKGST
jgi:hypothetical protein